MATVARELWIHDGGEISCAGHFGSYARAALQSRPTAHLLHTPIGSWERLSKADCDQLTEMGCTAVCETCTARERRAGRSA